MSIDVSGQYAKLKATSICIDVASDHPLIKLANTLPWAMLMAIVVGDLKKTTAKGYWWLGRKIGVRLHLAAYLLQKLYDLTDRQIEYAMKDNAAFQVFCGMGIVDNWHPIDHTKIEEFRSRLSPQTQRTLANELAKVSVACGFGDAKEADFDSTVQEANMAYPADASLMTKLCGLGKKVLEYIKEKGQILLPENIKIDMKGIKEKARSYFFLAKNAAIEKRREIFQELFQKVKQEMQPIIDICSALDPNGVGLMPWHIRRSVDQINAYARQYLLDVGHFVRTNTIKIGKVLSFHAQAVACIKKGKVGKDKEFGRVFQLGRIKGNFLFILASTSLRMGDKTSLLPLVEEHATLFGAGVLTSATADKGYWSAKNQQGLQKHGVKESGLQRPANIKSRHGLPNKERQEQLRDRRAGIEPLIGHAKHGGQLGKSRMKSDAATLAAGYASILGFNMRQLIRYQGGKVKKAA